MRVSVLIPAGGAPCEHRAAALEHVVERYRRLHPSWELVVAVGTEPWSKGAVVAEAFEQMTGDILVIADADTFVDADVLTDCVARVTADPSAWCVPHTTVYRLKQAETVRVLDGARPRLGHHVRAPYTGPAGGGIVVLHRSAYETVNGIDHRFIGWGGEDLSFGWALETLVGPYHRGPANLIHLWHPHPAPDLRGPAESEALVADYKAARGLPRRMSALVERQPLTDPVPLEQPARFRLADQTARRLVRIGSQKIRFTEPVFECDDPDLVDALRLHPAVMEVA